MTRVATDANQPPPPPSPQGNISPRIFLMQSLSHLNHLWMNMCRDLQAFIEACCHRFPLPRTHFLAT